MTYTDDDINPLLDQLGQLRADNIYLMRQWTQLDQIATALLNQLVSCQKENEGLKATLLQMHSRRQHDIN